MAAVLPGWFSGRTTDCGSVDPGSIPGPGILFFLFLLSSCCFPFLLSSY